MWFSPIFWRSINHAHEAHTFGWSLVMDPFFPNFDLVLFGEFDGVLWFPCFLIYVVKVFSGKKDLIHNVFMRTPFCIATDLFSQLLFDYLLGFPSASICRQWHTSSCIQLFRLVIQTYGRCQSLHDGFLQNLNRNGVSFLSNWSLWGFLSLVVSLLCFRTWGLLDHFCHCVSLLWNIIDVCAFHWKHSLTFLSTQALFLFGLMVNDPLSTTSLRTLKFRVLIIWSSAVL